MAQIKKMIRVISRGFNPLKRLFSRVYNAMPDSLKVVVMVATSTAIASYLTLFQANLKAYLETAGNEYIKVAVVFVIAIVAGAINVIQNSTTNSGTKLLASQRDPKTIKRLHKKVDDTRKLIPR